MKIGDLLNLTIKIKKELIIKIKIAHIIIKEFLCTKILYFVHQIDRFFEFFRLYFPQIFLLVDSFCLHHFVHASIMDHRISILFAFIILYTLQYGY
jgi:hypothetical protein